MFQTGLDPQRLKLLKSKLGNLLDWRIPKVVQTVGPFDPMAFDTFEKDRQRLVEDCAEKLRTYTDERIEVLFDRHAEDPHDTRRSWVNFRYSEVRHLRETQPPWYAGGFGHPEFVADFENWSKMPRLSIDEATSLSIGVEPGHFEKKSLDSMNQSPLLSLDEPLRFLVIRYRQLDRKFDPQSFGWSISPGDLLKWSRQVEFALHTEFEERLVRYHGAASKSQNSHSVKPEPDRREIDKIAQLFTAMAIDQLGYKPLDARSPIPGEIAGLAASMGLSVSDDTVRKYLRIGASFIPEDWKSD